MYSLKSSVLNSLPKIYIQVSLYCLRGRAALRTAICRRMTSLTWMGGKLFREPASPFGDGSYIIQLRGTGRGGGDTTQQKCLPVLAWEPTFKQLWAGLFPSFTNLASKWELITVSKFRATSNGLLNAMVILIPRLQLGDSLLFLISSLLACLLYSRSGIGLKPAFPTAYFSFLSLFTVKGLMKNKGLLHFAPINRTPYFASAPWCQSATSSPSSILWHLRSRKRVTCFPCCTGVASLSYVTLGGHHIAE